MEITTVKILRADSELGFELVNEHEFDPELMQLFVEPKLPAEKEKK